MSSSLQSTKSSELARIAAEAAGVQSSSLRFSITHGPAVTRVPIISGIPDAWPTDYCHFSVAGLSVSTCTWTSGMSAFSGRVQIGEPEAIGRPGAFQYSGHAVPNPGFLNQSTSRVDVLLTMGNTHWAPTYREALMQAFIIEQITGLAVEQAGAPLLHLHTPVAPFREPHSSERGDGSFERLRDAIGPCMRLAIGVDPATPGARLEFEKRLVELAETYGFGLKLDDRRFHRVRGEWFTIRGFDRERYRLARNRLFPGVPAEPPRRAVVASFIGPSRIGTTAVVVAALRHRGIGVLAASISSMRKTTFLNLVLPVVAGDESSAPAWSGDWEEALRRLEKCAGQPPGAPATIDEHLVADWKVAISPAMRCSYPPSSARTGATTTGRVPYPVWLWWQLPHRAVDTPRLLTEVQAALEPHARRCEVAYAQSRLVRGDLVRGRAKLVVLLSEGNRDHAAVQRLLSEATEAAEQRAREALFVAGRIDAGRFRLRLSPRENWLSYAGISA